MFLVISLKEASSSHSLFQILNENIESVRHFESMNDIKNCHRNYYIWVYSMKDKGWGKMNRVVNTNPAYGGTTLKDMIQEPMDKVVLQLDNDFLYEQKEVADIIRDLKLSLLI